MEVCRICKNRTNEEAFLFLKNIPISSEAKNENFKSTVKDLRINRCIKCNYLFIDNQLNDTYYDDYLYTPQVSKDVKDYLNNFTSKVIKKFPINSTYKGLEIGSGEGSLCLAFKEKGIDFTGVEPSEHLSKESIKIGVKTFNSYFGDGLISELNSDYDFIVIRHVLEHIDDFENFFLNILKVSKDSTKLIIEVPYLGNILKEKQYYGFFFEHLSYFSIESLSILLNKYGFYINDYEFANPEGGSILIYTSKKKNDKLLIDTFNENDFNDFKGDFTSFKSKFLEFILKFKHPVIYGAGQRSLTLISMLNLSNKEILCIFDENTNFDGLYTPEGKIKIINASNMENFVNKNKVDAIFIFASSYDKEIYSKYLSNQNIMYSIIPNIEKTSFKYKGINNE
ncbi:MAG: class I SAM-dependent methyltransferase [Campylobacteraceae bacterium]|nr:class I SAM-dependent methyltransferase [Campylobacteraceae bacterium]